MPLSCASFRNGHATRGRMESNLLFFLARSVRKSGLRIELHAAQPRFDGPNDDALRLACELHDAEASMPRSGTQRVMYVTLIGIFDNVMLAQEAKDALLAAGVPEARIDVELHQAGACVVRVQAQSSYERERIRDLLHLSGASSTQQLPTSS